MTLPPSEMAGLSRPQQPQALCFLLVPTSLWIVSQGCLHSGLFLVITTDLPVAVRRFVRVTGPLVVPPCAHARFPAADSVAGGTGIGPSRWWLPSGRPPRSRPCTWPGHVITPRDRRHARAAAAVSLIGIKPSDGGFVLQAIRPR